MVKYSPKPIDKLKTHIVFQLQHPIFHTAKGQQMKFRVTAMLRNSTGEVVPMKWLKEGDRFSATYSVMSILSQDNDRPWAELVSVHVDVIEGE